MCSESQVLQTLIALLASRSSSSAEEMEEEDEDEEAEAEAEEEVDVLWNAVSEVEAGASRASLLLWRALTVDGAREVFADGNASHVARAALVGV